MVPKDLTEGATNIWQGKADEIGKIGNRGTFGKTYGGSSSERKKTDRFGDNATERLCTGVQEKTSPKSKNTKNPPPQRLDRTSLIGQGDWGV